jgi:uncharacterized SAM-binding protein YcdF (DUF218 family)
LVRRLFPLCEPIGLVWLALLGLTVVLWRRRLRGFAAATLGLALWVLLIGGTDFSAALLRSLERPYAGVKAADLPACDAVVVLGGGFEPSPHEVAELHLTPAGDRIVMALELVRLGKAPVLCIGGSGVVVDGRHFIESELVKAALAERKVTDAELIALGRCTNTCDEARRVRELVRARGWQRVLLVTSASHLRRAMATFRTAGVEAVPAPCNFLGLIGEPISPWRLGPPGYGGFARFSTWMREWVGWHVYRARGWIAADAR